MYVIFRTLACTIFAAAVMAPMSTPARAQANQPVNIDGNSSFYEVFATNARVNRRVTGTPTSVIQGVPAQPVDSAVWNGIGSTRTNGSIIVALDPETDEGFIQASWTDQHGAWTYTQTRFLHPEHGSGVRASSSANKNVEILNEGVIANVYLHGDSKSGPPILPTVFTHLASWGPADVTLNGEPFLNPFIPELNAPLQWGGHMMLTEGVRRPDGTVHAADGSIYNVMKQAEGEVDFHDLEVHLVFHDERFPEVPENIPNLFSFFYHMVFEDVSVRMVQADNLIRGNSP